ncbi:hypothetical protein M0R45_036293 [Rubus argutus]|uniref:DUF8039 domain-containing protein n=1 Tax=Rubus argutus TaxID=59490 RepID=A0AAW1W0P3_RUBAR
MVNHDLYIRYRQWSLAAFVTLLQQIYDMAETSKIGTKRGRKDSNDHARDSDECSKTTPQNEPNSGSTDNGKKKTRGKTTLQVIPTGKKNRQSLEWNERGQPVGEVSKKFSSTVGVIVQESIPINIISWHKVKIDTKNSAWGLLMQKYIMDLSHKPFILQQMGRLWRSWKSELSTQLRTIFEARATKSDRTRILATLKPSEVKQDEWDDFVNERKSVAWTEKSEKMKEIRAKQILTHTMSRKGYARLEYECNMNNPEKPLTRAELWIKGHEQKKSKNEHVAAKIAEIQTKLAENPIDLENPIPLKEDVLTQVLGKERPGRVRGLGAGVTPSKVDAALVNSQQIQGLVNLVNSMKERQTMLENLLAQKLGINLHPTEHGGDGSSFDPVAAGTLKNPSGHGDGSAHMEAATSKLVGLDNTQPSINDKCKLLNWEGTGEVLASGSLSAIDPNSKVHGSKLGPDCYRISIEKVFKPKAEFYRSQPQFDCFEDALGSTIAWPIKYIVFEETL